jgi:hypothetical protein
LRIIPTTSLKGASTIKTTDNATPSAQQPTLTRQIGSTTYIVSICFSQTSAETIEGKILRMLERGVPRSA